MNNLQAKLRECRLFADKKQKDIAEYLDVTQSTYSKWEQGKAEPCSAQLVKIATFYNVTTDYLLGRENDIGLIEIKNELSTDENKLLKDFRACPAAEQRVLLDYADMLYSRVEKEKKKVERF